MLPVILLLGAFSRYIEGNRQWEVGAQLGRDVDYGRAWEDHERFYDCPFPMTRTSIA